MSQKKRLLFVHGWGFSNELWSPLTDLLQDYDIDYIDLGYINNKKTSDDFLQKIKSRQETTIAIGHSLGFLYLLKQFPLKFHHYVAINSFLRFSRRDEFASGVPLRILQRMSKGIEKNSFLVLSQFYEQCQYKRSPPTFMNQIELNNGLEWLKQDDLRSILPEITDKLSVIASNQDPVVSKEMTIASFQNHSIYWENDQTHILPITKPNICATIIRDVSL